MCERNRGETISKNPFVEIALSYALTYINTLLTKNGVGKSISPSRLIILADNAYYSQPASSGGAAEEATGRFARFPVTLKGANKTGLGSSAALVTSFTGSVLTHYLPKELFDLTTDKGKKVLHNLAQAAHCAAQGKVGSGFDVAAAVYGSCRYKRFSPSLLSSIPEPGAPGFAAALSAVVEETNSENVWDVEVEKDLVSVPKGVTLRMCDVDCGSQTVSMVKKVLAWKAADAEGSKKLWDDLQSRNDELAGALKDSKLEDLPARLSASRKLIKEMGDRSEVPIEPDTQTELLDAVSKVDGVFGGVVPGAGGFDAVALLMKDDEETKTRVDKFLSDWSETKDSKVKLLNVRGEMDGVREEKLDVYTGWI